MFKAMWHGLGSEVGETTMKIFIWRFKQHFVGVENCNLSLTRGVGSDSEGM
jgi:hypothetical protein